MTVLQTQIRDMLLVKKSEIPDTWIYYSDKRGIYYIEKNSLRKRYSDIKKCEHCERNFASRKNCNHHKYCCKICSEFGSQRQVLVKCKWCSSEVTKRKSQVERSQSSIFFCNRICKEKAQSIDGGVKEIQPTHYGTGGRSYVERAFRKYENKCVDCDVTFRAFLEVHHKDGNRENAHIDNLEIVCLMHHYTRHMKYSEITNSWIVDFKHLTSKEDLVEILKISKIDNKNGSSVSGVTRVKT